MSENIIQEASLLKEDLKEKLIPVNALLIKARQLGLSICVHEKYSDPKGEDELISPQVGVRFSIHL